MYEILRWIFDKFTKIRYNKKIKKKGRECVLSIYFGMAAFLCAGSLLWKQTSPLQGEFLEKNQKQLQNLFLMTAALIFIFVATFRYGIGYDYFNYENLYEQLGPLSIQQLVTDHVGREFIGYSIFTHLCWELGLSYRMLLFVVNIILTAIVFWFLKRYSPLPWLGAYLYLTLQFFAHSMNLFRQSIAATICLLAFPFLKKRKLIFFVLVVLLASAFHISALFLLPFYWILNWKVDGRIYGVIAAISLPIYLFSTQAAQFLTHYLFQNYAGYIGSHYWAGLGKRYVIFPAIYFVAVWFFRKRLLNQDEKNRILINSSFYVLILYVFSTHHMILERFSIYLFMYAMVLLPKLVCTFCQTSEVEKADKKRAKSVSKRTKNTHNQKKKEIVFLASVLVVTISFGYLIFASQQGTNGFHKVYPYVSVWTEQ